MALWKFWGATRFAGRAKSLAPGILLAVTIAIAATFLGEHYGAPVMLFALLIGMAFHFMSSDAKCSHGIDFSSKHLLRVGVALLGARITVNQIMDLGLGPIMLVLFCVVFTIGLGLLLGRVLGRGGTFGILTGGAVAICGASAALAISAVLPPRGDHERNTLFTVIAVTSLSTVAMIIYPILFSAVGFNNVETGILIGATIHDVAQVVGAGYAVSEEAGDIATYVKLLRVSLLPLVVIVVAFVTQKSSSAGEARWPLFTVAFALILLTNSFQLIPELLRTAMVDLSRWLLVSAIAALGVKTSLQAMLQLGPGHMAVVVIETVFLATVAMSILAIL